MTAEEFLRNSFVSLEVNPDCSEALVSTRDGSRLCFHHRVGERWVKAPGPGGTACDGTLAVGVLAMIALFRLNAKHLDVVSEMALAGKQGSRIGGQTLLNLVPRISGDAPSALTPQRQRAIRSENLRLCTNERDYGSITSVISRFNGPVGTADLRRFGPRWLEVPATRPFNWPP